MCIVGIDVPKARRDVAVRPAGEQWGAPNDPERIDDNKELAALVGVAALSRDSGVFRGKRRVWGVGRRCARCYIWPR